MPELVQDRWPAFAEELSALLARSAEPHLAGAVSSLEFFGWHACGDDCCQSFHTAPLSNEPYLERAYTVELDTQVGMVNVDVVDGEIVFVEALYRPELHGSS